MFYVKKQNNNNNKKKGGWGVLKILLVNSGKLNLHLCPPPENGK